MRWAVAVTVAVSLAAGCDGGDAFLAIDVKTDLRPGAEFDLVDVRVTHDGRALDPQTMAADAAALEAFARGTRVAEYGPIATGDVVVRVALELAGGEVIDREVRLELRENTAVVVVLRSRCIDITCPQPDHPERSTCGDDGMCVDPRCSEATPRYCPQEDAGGVDAGPPDSGENDTGPPPCTMPCDDGDQCTHDDRCRMDGTCRGTALTCASDACNVRSCNGTASCSLTQPMPPAGCADDGNVCTADWCDGMGACIHAALDFFGPGHMWGSGYFDRCCGGTPQVVNSDAHCGGCGISCGGRGCVDLGFGFTSCNCSSNAECRGTCYNGISDCPEPDGRGWLCQCQTNADCGPGQTCTRVGCRHWCHY